MLICLVVELPTSLQIKDSTAYPMLAVIKTQVKSWGIEG